MASALRNLKARYNTIGPRKEMVTFNKCSYDLGGRGLIQEELTEEMQVWYVRFPQGHTTRFVGKQGLIDLKRLGYDKKPRLIDMDTGDVVDTGGDPYDFDTPVEDDNSIVVLDDVDDNENPEQTGSSRSKKG